MTDKPIDYASIQWIRGEIENNTEQAIQALEGYFETQDSHHLTEAKTALHQIYGTLQIVELYPPATLAQEVEKTLDSIHNSKASMSPDTISEIIQCINLIVRFIDSTLQDEQPLDPSELIRPLNILRVIRHEPIIEPLTAKDGYFKDQAFQSTNDDNSKNVHALALKLLKLFQFSYLKFVEGLNQDTNLTYMKQSIERFSRLFPQHNLSPLWNVLLATFESISLNDQFKTVAPLNEFLGKVTHLLKIFASIKSRSVNSGLLTDLFLQALQLLSKLEQTTESGQLLLKHHADKLRATKASPQLNKATLHALSDALTEEIGYVKDALDIFARSKNAPVEDLEKLYHKLHQLADSMILIQALEIPRQALTQQIMILDKIITTRTTPEQDWLIDLATALLFVESSAQNMKLRLPLSTSMDSSALDILAEARKAVLREVLIDISTIKSLFVDCVSANWDVSSLYTIIQMLSATENQLYYIDEYEVMALLERIGQYIAQDLINRTIAPSWDEIEEFADVIAALDQYLYLRIDAKKHNSDFIKQAEQRLNALFKVTDEQRASQLDQSLVISNQELESLVALDKSADPATHAPITAPLEATEQEEHDEIQEIFREELAEITEELTQNIHDLSNNQDDQQCLASIRRLVHTVKGSGRVAQMPIISEPAWALETLLNDLLDKNQQPNLGLIHSISEFVQKIEYIVSPSNQDAQEVSQHFIAIFSPQPVHTLEQITQQDNFELDDELDLNADSKTELLEDCGNNHEIKLFSDMQRREIHSHVEFLDHYINTNQQYLDQAPQDEAMLRAMHTLKAIFKSCAHNRLGHAFTEFEELIRIAMKLNQHKNTLFFQTLEAAATLIHALLSGNMDPLVSIDQLQIHNSELSLHLDAKTASKSPYELWLEQNYDIFDILIKNASYSLNIDMIIENQTLFDEAASFALDENLFELQDILTSFSCYSAQITCLNTEQQQPFFETGQKLQESLLNFADRIALGQGAIDLKPTLVEFKNACTELELAIQQNAVNAESITPDISQTQDLEAQALHIEPLTSDIVDKHLEADDVDDDIMSVFQEELSDILSSIDLQLTKLLQEEATLTNLQELQRDYHTIKGGANYIHEHFIAEMAKEADLICERFIDARKLPTQDVLSLLKLTQNLFQDRLRKLPTVLPLSDIESSILEDLRRAKPAAPVHADTEYQPQEYQPQEQPHQDELQQDALNDSVKANDQDIEQTIEPLVLQTRDGFEYKEVTLDRATFTLNEKNVDIVEIFLEEADELLEELAAINSHLTGQDQQINLESLSSSTLRIIHTLKGGARLAGIDIIGDTANRFEKQLEKTDPRLLTDYAPVLDKFRLNVKDIVADIGQLLKFDPPGDSESVTIETIPVLIDANTTAEQFEFNENLAQASTEDVVNVSAEGKNHSTVPIHNPQALSPTTAQSTETLEEYDPEILEIFFEESKELAEELEKAVGQITDQKIDEAIMDQLKRILHTVKGSARLAGFSEFGNQAHLFESRLESLQTPTTEAETAEVITLNDGLFASLQHTLKSIEDHLKQDTVPDVPVVASANTVLVQPKPRQKPAKRKKNTEVVRIGAELLEKLVNLAGETVISRSSVQQELLGFNRIIDDFGLTLDRIRDQIRNF